MRSIFNPVSPWNLSIQRNKRVDLRRSFGRGGSTPNEPKKISSLGFAQKRPKPKPSHCSVFYIRSRGNTTRARVIACDQLTHSRLASGSRSTRPTIPVIKVNDYIHGAWLFNSSLVALPAHGGSDASVFTTTINLQSIVWACPRGRCHLCDRC